MRNIRILILISFFFSKLLVAQEENNSSYFSKKEIIGTWQRNDSLIGSGLNQNFEFFNDGTFVLYLGSNGDDVRETIKLKGKFRLNKNELYFTITSRTKVEGDITIPDQGISANIFSIQRQITKEVPEMNPREFLEPCFITIIKNTHIKINNEVYFKVK